MSGPSSLKVLNSDLAQESTENSLEEVQRGVVNPYVVDLISGAESTREVTLVIVEDRVWGSDSQNAMLKELEVKYNSYLEYVLGGFLAKDYPLYTDWKVKVCLVSKSSPDEQATRFIRAMNQCAQDHNWLFEHIVDPECSAAHDLPPIQ